MQKKLTLRLDDELIAVAKAQAAGAGKSLSRLVAEYFDAIKKSQREPMTRMTPTVARMRGSWKGANVDERDYHAYLEEKYLGKRGQSGK